MKSSLISLFQNKQKKKEMTWSLIFFQTNLLFWKRLPSRHKDCSDDEFLSTLDTHQPCTLLLLSFVVGEKKWVTREPRNSLTLRQGILPLRGSLQHHHRHMKGTLHHRRLMMGTLHHHRLRLLTVIQATKGISVKGTLLHHLSSTSTAITSITKIRIRVVPHFFKPVWLDSVAAVWWRNAASKRLWNVIM